MKLLVDEQIPLQFKAVLAYLLPTHSVNHVHDLHWKSKKDVSLLSDAKKRQFDVFLTNDLAQLSDPKETDAIRRSRIHHVRFRIPSTRRAVPVGNFGLALGAVAAAMPLVMVELAQAKSQRLVLIKGVSGATADRFEALDPQRDPPRYWK